MEARYLVPLDDTTLWLEKFAADMLPTFPWLHSFFVKVQVFTSIGKTFEARIEKRLRTELVNAARQKGASDKA